VVESSTEAVFYCLICMSKCLFYFYYQGLSIDVSIWIKTAFYCRNYWTKVLW